MIAAYNVNIFMYKTPFQRDMLGSQMFTRTSKVFKVFNDLDSPLNSKLLV